MCLESQALDEQINSLLSKIKSLPEGKLVCARNTGSYFKWYRSDGHKSVYLPKSERKLAEKLAIKKYLSLLIEDLQNEKCAIDFYLRHYVPNKAEKMLNMPEYRELLTPFFRPKSEEIQEWINSPYKCNERYLEQKIHKTSSGVLVRSKSETLIEMALYTNKIPFRYECELLLDDSIIYPDFTIMHPITGEIYYWEHFGMMDNPRYVKSTGEKLQLYMSHGIIPSINLITSYETIKNPFSYKDAEKIVADYFL